MNYARSWRQEQSRQREDAALQVMSWVMLAAAVVSVLVVVILGI